MFFLDEFGGAGWAGAPEGMRGVGREFDVTFCAQGGDTEGGIPLNPTACRTLLESRGWRICMYVRVHA